MVRRADGRVKRVLVLDSGSDLGQIAGVDVFPRAAVRLSSGTQNFAAAMKPAFRPANPHFASGPCAKPPGWRAAALEGALTGRYHRSAPARAKLREVVERTRALLAIPSQHRIAILPGSDTGAIECAMWNLLGPRGVDVLAFDNFGHDWAIDVIEQLKIPNARRFAAPYGEMPDLALWDRGRDLVFTWTGTTAGTCVPDGGFIPEDRHGLTICDATAAVFAIDLPWEKLDAATFSWQKAIGGEAQHGVLVLGPRAVARLESYTPAWPVPKLFRIKRDGRFDDELADGGVINTPSMLGVEDALLSLKWIERVGGLKGMIARARTNRAVIDAWIEKSGWAAHLPQDPGIRPPTPVAMRFAGPRLGALAEPAQRRAAFEIAELLEAENAAFDINGYRKAPPGLRVWTGGTVESRDLAALLPWLDWAHDRVTARR